MTSGFPQDVVLKHFGPGALEEIEKILGVASPNASLRFELALALHKYAEPNGSGLASPALVSRRLKTIGATARQLRDAIGDFLLDESADIGTVAVILGAAGVDLSALEVHLNALLAATENIRKSRGGRPPVNVDYGVLMMRLAGIYHAATGREATVTAHRVKGVFSGRFFRLAELVDHAAASASKTKPMTNGALGELLRKIRGKTSR
jgi:hypothetical protein